MGPEIISTIPQDAETGQRQGLSWLALVGTLFAPLIMAAPATAIILNDPMAAQLPGPGTPDVRVGNWYDSGNTMPAVVSLYDPAAASYCTGTLINHRAVLTAAHCLYDKSSGAFYPATANSEVRFNPDSRIASPNDRRLGGALFHPGYLTPAATPNLASNDIALLSLANPVTGVKPVTVIAAGQALPAPGSLVRITGYGDYGTASGAQLYDGRRRVGDTTLAAVNANSSIVTQFRDPDDPQFKNFYNLQSPVPQWEATTAPGDSGGPLFKVLADGSIVQIGVLSFGGKGYGSLSNFTSVGFHKDWIDANNPLRYVSAEAGASVWSNSGAWTDSVATATSPREIPNNRDGSLTASPPGEIGRYYEVHISKASQIAVDMSPMIDRLVIANNDAVLDILHGSRLGIVLDAMLNSGHLQIDGVLSTGEFSDPDPANRSASFTQYGGRISGTGRIIVGNGFVQHGGIIAPGDMGRPGTLTIQGDFYQNAAGVIAVRVDETLGSDRLIVTGKANIAGTLSVTTPNTAPVAKQKFVVLQAGELSGQFSSIDIALPAFTWTTNIVGNQVILSSGIINYVDDVPVLPFARRNVAINAVNSAGVLNQIAERIPAADAVAAAASVVVGQVPFPSTPALAIASLNTMDAPTLAAALVALPPTGFHAQSASGGTILSLVSGVISDRLGAIDGTAGSPLNSFNGSVDAQSAPFVMSYLARTRSAEPVPGAPGAFGAIAPMAAPANLTPFGLFVAGSYMASGSNTSTPFTAGAVTAGLDYRMTSNITMGAAVSYANDARNADGTKFENQSVAPVVYGRFSLNQMFVNAYIGYGFINGTSKRAIPFGDEVLAVEASPGGGQFMAGATAGVKLDATSFGLAGAAPSAWSLTPFLGLDVARMNFDSYVERGAGALAINLSARQFDEARVTAGIELAIDLPMAGGILTPRLKASMTQRIGDVRDNTNAAYVIAPDLPFAVTGPANQRTYGTLGAGLRFRANDAIAADISYVADVSNGGLQDSRFTAKASIQF